MQNPSSKRLLVEGHADVAFFETLCREAGFKNKEIWIGPPSDFNQKGNGKGNALQALEDAMDSLRSGQVTHLGIVIDADFSTNQNDGFVATYDKVVKIVTAHGYSKPESTPIGNFQGFTLTHPRKLPTIGAWIMPDNKNDGYLEHFCINAADSSEKNILDHAKKSISTLETTKFPPHFLAKVETATWLAWQASPGQGLNSLIGNKLIDTNNAAYKGLLQWLKTIFSSKTL